MAYFAHHPDYTVFVNGYWRVRLDRPEFVRQHFRRPWGSVCARVRVTRRFRIHWR